MAIKDRDYDKFDATKKTLEDAKECQECGYFNCDLHSCRLYGFEDLVPFNKICN